MILENILSRERTICRLESTSKKRTFEYIADLLSSLNNTPPIEPDHLIELLNTRERLGSTAIGKGIAIPHCRCTQVTEPMGFLITLQQPVDFDAPDDQKVDIIFLLLVPDDDGNDYLSLLSSLADLFRSIEFRNQIRKVDTSDSLYYTALNFERRLETGS